LPLPQNEIRTESKHHRSIQLAVVAASLIWFAAASQIATQAARGLAVRLNLSDEYQLLQAVFLLFLLIVGTMFLQSIFASGTPIRRLMGLPRRPSAHKEWATGAAIGWGIVLLAVLPQALFGTLYVRLWIAPRSLFLLVLNLATVAVFSRLCLSPPHRRNRPGMGDRRHLRALRDRRQLHPRVHNPGGHSLDALRSRPLPGMVAHPRPLAGLGNSLCLDCQSGHLVRPAG
jgi:hypothetical protein